MLKKIGLELEFSDINSDNALKLVYNYFNQDLSNYKYNLNIYKKNKLNYNIWNCVLDDTIKNSDKSYCMKGVYDNQKFLYNTLNNNKNNYKFCKGVEVVSPASNNYNKLLNDTKNVIDIMLNNKASIKKELDNALHIHIDASDLTFKQIKQILKRIYTVQSYFKKFLTKHGIVVPEFTKKEIDNLINIKNKKDFYKQYRTFNNNLLKKTDCHIRRIIDVGPYFNRPIENRTIEFRCYSMSTNIEYIKECIYLSLDIYDYLLNGTEVLDLENRTKYIESLYTDSDY
jgi:hypothetical protein